MNDQTRRLRKIIISVFLIFHLTIIIIFPNISSYLWQVMSPVMLPYANALGINSAWQFFAPEPEAASYFEYEIEKRSSGQDVLDPVKFQFPGISTGWFDFSFNRKISAKSFLFSQTQFIPMTLAPYLCRQHPEASGIVFRKCFVRIPNLKEVQEGLLIYDPTDVRTEDIYSMSCEGGNEHGGDPNE